MRKRHPNPRLVKIHRNYTVEEIARLFSVHKNTVRAWVKAGLAVIDDRRPMLVLGRDLVTFLQARREKNRQRCKPGELYCVRCRSTRSPAGDMADYTPFTEKYGNLTAICPECDSIMNRRVSLAQIGHFCEKMDISFPEGVRHIIERIKPTVNCDLREGVLDHEKAQCGQ